MGSHVSWLQSYAQPRFWYILNYYRLKLKTVNGFRNRITIIHQQQALSNSLYRFVVINSSFQNYTCVIVVPIQTQLFKKKTLGKPKL